MPTAVILQPDARIRLDRESLEVIGREPDSDSDSETILREIPLRDVERLILAESVQITSQAMGAVLRREIPVSWMSGSGRFLGSFVPATPAHGAARIRQYQRTLDAEFALQVAGRIVTAKLYNQRRVLQRLQGARKESATEPADAERAAHVHDALAFIDDLFRSLRRATQLDELRGYEGAATARYFSAWARFLPAAFPFERRSTRPPLNPVNACISFGATLLYNEIAALCHARGLDPALGVLHATEDGRWSLPLDLIEPFRPALVEALTLDCFSHQILNASHFEPAKGGIHLNDAGRRKFILQYERRMERQFLSEFSGHRTTIRQVLDDQIVHFKVNLEDPTRFEGFLMN
jgi:CRISPR-associated protein Cas1